MPMVITMVITTTIKTVLIVIIITMVKVFVTKMMIPMIKMMIMMIIKYNGNEIDDGNNNNDDMAHIRYYGRYDNILSYWGTGKTNRQEDIVSTGCSFRIVLSARCFRKRSKYCHLGSIC